MSLSGDDRIQTITELVTALFDQPAIGIGQTQTLTISRNGIYENDQYTDDENLYSPEEDEDGYYDDEYDDYDDYDEAEVEGNDVSTFDKIKIPVIIGVLLVAIILVIVVILFKLFTGDNSSRLRDNYSSDESSISDNIVDITEETEPEETKESKAGK